MPSAERQHLRLVHSGPRPGDDVGHAGATPASREVIDGVVTTLANLARGASVELALRVGEVVVQQIYGGDLEALRRRGQKDASFRKLAAHPRLPFSAVTLWRSVAIYELIQRMPGLAKVKHLGVAHLRAILGLPHHIQERLLRAAETERWTKERLEDRAAKYRQKDEKRRGGRPLPTALRCLRQIERITSKEISSVGGIELGQLDEGRIHDARERIERIREWCIGVEKALNAGGLGAAAAQKATHALVRACP